MNILVQGMYEKNTQNPKIMNIVCDELIKAGHNVIRFFPCSSKKEIKKLKNIGQVYTFFFKDETKYVNYQRELKEISKSKIKVLTKLMKHPFFSYRWILEKLFSSFELEKKLAQKISKHIEIAVAEKQIECVITSNNPTFFPLATAMANIERVKKIWIQLDTYEENFSSVEFIYGVMDKILIQPNAINGFNVGFLDKYKDKVSTWNFPLLNLEKDTGSDKSFFNSDRINCVYAGALMMPVRRPEFMLNIFSEFEKENVDLHIWSATLTKDQKKELQQMLKPQQFFHGSLPQNEMQKVLNDADFLVNIGNTVSNLFPSKILDYISLGIPIINIYKIDDCPAKKILDKYPLCLNIFENSSIEGSKNNLLEFIKNSFDKRVPKETIINLYSEYLPENSVKEIEKRIRGN